MTDVLPHDLQARKVLVSTLRAEIERPKMMIAKLPRTQFGRSPVYLDAMIDQLQLSLIELEVSQAAFTSVTESAMRTVSRRKPLPEHPPAKFMSINPIHNAPVVVGRFADWGRTYQRFWNTFRYVSR